MKTFNNFTTYKFSEFTKIQLIDLCYGIGLQYHFSLKKLMRLSKKELVKFTLEREEDIRKLIYDNIIYVSSNGHLRFDRLHESRSVSEVETVYDDDDDDVEILHVMGLNP
jgi:hypothetical protein